MPKQKQGSSPKLRRVGKKTRTVANPKPVTRHKAKTAPFDPANTLVGLPDDRDVNSTRVAVQAAYKRARQQEAIQLLHNDAKGTASLLLDELLPQMASSSPKAHDALAGMLVQFLEVYAFTSNAELKLNQTDRLNYAMQMVLKGRPFGKVEQYFNKTVRDTYASLEAQVSQQAKAS